MTAWRSLVVVALACGSTLAQSDGPPLPASWQGQPLPGQIGGLVVPAGPPAMQAPPTPYGGLGLSVETMPGPVVPARPLVVAPTVSEKLVESTWYTRVDYFHWNERLDSMDFVNESGPLFTLGYVRRVGRERFRAELFGGRMDYDGFGQFDWGLEPLHSSTRYLGARGEYELILRPEWWSDVALLAGIGTRFWVRDIRSGFSDMGNWVWGYQETWWTIYPFLGLEVKRPLGALELYTATRLGATVLTYELPTILDVPLYPRPGFLGQVELGLRGERLSLAGYFEAMTWSQSGDVDGSMQPNSRMYTVGGKLSYTF